MYITHTLLIGKRKDNDQYEAIAIFPETGALPSGLAAVTTGRFVASLAAHSRLEIVFIHNQGDPVVKPQEEWLN